MKTKEPNREEYRNSNGIAAWWAKDGMWHVARPAPEIDPATGLKSGGFLWTAEEYPNRAEAVAALTL
ncbi:hypothetical protein BH20VER3_BH20VER3_00630 [soil metagenome]